MDKCCSEQVMGQCYSRPVSGRGIRKNRAHCDRNLTFGTKKGCDKTKILRYMAIAGLSLKQKGCHFFKNRWRPFCFGDKSAMALYLKIFVRPYSIIVPNFKFLSQSAQFPQILHISLPLSNCLVLIKTSDGLSAVQDQQLPVCLSVLQSLLSILQTDNKLTFVPSVQLSVCLVFIEVYFLQSLVTVVV